MDDADIAVLPATIAELPFFATGRHPRPDLIGRCTGSGVEYVAAKELIEQVRDFGLGLAAAGLTRGDRVALISESRPEWIICDFAILTAGAVTVPVYPTLSAEQVGFILRDAGVKLAIVSNLAQLAKLEEAAASVPSLSAIVVLDPSGGPRTPGPIPVMTYREAAETGHRAIVENWGVGRAFREAARGVRPQDLATIIYTSGTTGQPKGVMLTHANLVANLDGIRQVIALSEDDVGLSFLPLCHGFERMVAYYYLASGISTVFAESFDTVARDLRQVRPTVMTGVPRVFEKMYDRIVSAGLAASGLRRVIFTRALEVARIRGARLPAGRRLSPRLVVESWLAERLVFRRIREQLGGRIRFVVSGSAALRTDIAMCFYGVGVPILEGYGLTETSPVVSAVPLDRIRFGTVGPPLPNVEVRIADDGEILVRGPNVMQGYHGRPDATAEAIRDGWFHTGDIGEIDEAGYLRITDRKKELLVTSGGKKVAPQPIESALRAHPLVGEAVLVGEQRHFPAALLVPDFAALGRTLGVEVPSDEPARRALLERDDVQRLYQEAVDRANAGLARFEQIKRFRLLDREFTVESGELTPTLKVKRRVIEKVFQSEIETLYEA